MLNARSDVCMSSAIQPKPLRDALYLQGAVDKNISSERPLRKLLIQTGNLGSGKASQANLRSDLKGEQELITRLPEQAVQTKGAEGVQVRLRQRSQQRKKSKRRERKHKHGPVRELEKL